MAILAIYHENEPQKGQRFSDFDAIERMLNHIGVQFEHWKLPLQLSSDINNQEVLNAYAYSIEGLKKHHDFQSVDVMRMQPHHPEKQTLRQKFLAEHTHDDFEVRFFVDGSALFYLHVEEKVYVVLCEQGDLISVPANTPHWFDMGENPNFTCIRFFTNPEGWVANFTENEISARFPTFEEFIEQNIHD